MNDQKPQQNCEAVGLSRRHFLRAASVAAAGATALDFPSVLAQTKQPIRAVIIGLGGRGGGAGANFIEAAKNLGVDGKIVAVADLFPEQARRGAAAPFNLPVDKCFDGFQAYQKALAVPDVNYAIIATPPGFRPGIYKGCIEAGKNVFMEKPVAVDGPGARIMYATGEEATKKGLKVAAGTQRRHQADYIETIKRIHDGAIGDVVALRAYWVNDGPIWHRGDTGATSLEKQIRNWYHYIWLCGDHICEQHVHNLDVCNWIMKTHPIKAWGQGARQMLGNKSGEIWDNFAIEYEYPGNVHLASYCGQIKRKWSSVSEAVHGTKGWANPNNTISPKEGQPFRFRGNQIDAYVQEHMDLINAIHNNTELNETKNVTDSTLTAIMGREAAYSGSGVEWDQILNSKWMYGPHTAYSDPSGLTWEDFRTLKPPLPSLHDIFSTPPAVPTVG